MRHAARRLAIGAVAACLAGSGGCLAQTIRIPIAGTHVAADVGLPETLPAPVVIIAPGQAYPRNGYLLEEMARQAARAGFASIRFDWRYTAEKGDASPQLVREIEDYRAVVAWARSDPRFRGMPVYASGKSLGTMAAARVFAEDPALAGAVLLTPVCRDAQETESFYGKLRAESRTVAWIQGASDPVCPLDTLYRWAIGTKVALTVLPGNQSFVVKAGDKAANDAVSRDAASVAVRWLVQVQASRGEGR